MSEFFFVSIFFLIPPEILKESWVRKPQLMLRARQAHLGML